VRYGGEKKAAFFFNAMALLLLFLLFHYWYGSPLAKGASGGGDFTKVWVFKKHGFTFKIDLQEQK
jgi:hypothetical protein